MKRILSVLSLIMISQLVFSQEYQAEFIKYFEENKTAKQLKVLEQWEAEYPEDPELFTSYFNYYFFKARTEELLFEDDISSEKVYVRRYGESLEDKNLVSNIYYDSTAIIRAFEKIDEGISLHPNRLDMRFGKIFALGQLKDWEAFASTIIQTIEYSAENDNNWIWSNDEVYEGGEEAFLAEVIFYQTVLYNTGNDDLLIHMALIGEAILQYYPDNVENQLNLPMIYYSVRAFDRGINLLSEQIKENPDDYLLLGKIAEGYKFKEDYEQAIEYYSKMMELGDERAKEYANQQILFLEVQLLDAEEKSFEKG